jgi:hypothetical protein
MILINVSCTFLQKKFYELAFCGAPAPAPPDGTQIGVYPNSESPPIPHCEMRYHNAEWAGR